MKGERGQVSIENIMGLIITLVLFGATAGIMVTFIQMAQNSTDALTDTILDLLLPALAIMILYGIVKFGRFYYDEFAGGRRY